MADRIRKLELLGRKLFGQVVLAPNVRSVVGEGSGGRGRRGWGREMEWEERWNGWEER